MATQPKAARQRIKFGNFPIGELPGLSESDCYQLAECGIFTTKQLLVKGNTAENRLALASKLQRPVHYVNKWVALADLARVQGVGCQYCGLLLHAGVSSVNQLAQISPQKLHQQVLRLQVAMMQRRDLCPSVDQVFGWIQQAKMILIT